MNKEKEPGSRVNGKNTDWGWNCEFQLPLCHLQAGSIQRSTFVFSRLENEIKMVLSQAIVVRIKQDDVQPQCSICDMSLISS